VPTQTEKNNTFVGTFSGDVRAKQISGAKSGQQYVWRTLIIGNPREWGRGSEKG